MRIFRYFKRYWVSVLLIMMLLIVQAFTDLSLPNYTSDIVDVGIQQNGIENAVADQMRPETLDELELFMDDDQTGLVASSYTLGDDGYLHLNVSRSDTSTIDALDDALAAPETIIGMLRDGIDAQTISSGSDSSEQTQALAAMAQANGGTITIDQFDQAVSAGLISHDDLLSMKQSLVDAMGNMSGSVLTQRAVSFVANEYTAMGIDTSSIQSSYLNRLGLIMLGLSGLGLLASVLVGLIGARAAAGIGRDLRHGVFSNVLSFSKETMNKFSPASLITRSTNDIQLIQLVSVMLVRIILYAPVLGIGAIIMVVQRHTGLEWIIIVAVAIMLGIVISLISFTMPKFKIMQKLVDKVNLVSREMLTGIFVIRAFGREKHEEKRFEAASTDLYRTQLFTNRAMSLMMPLMMLLMNCVTVAIVWFSAQGIQAGNMQVGDMIAFITYTMQIVMAFMMITMIAIFLPRANVAAERIDEVIAAKATVLDPDEPQALDVPTDEWKGVIDFDHVMFRYPGAEHDVLSNIDFTAESGQTTAIIGSTGSGKSTLIDLILRGWDVTGGAVRIDGIDVRDLTLAKLHSLIGYVPQKGILFSGDISSNIKFGDEGIDDARMRQAAAIAQSTDFISERPEGFEAPVSQGGGNVSGGQRQRLSIARALAINPRILLFDDSFSALDYTTDAKLRQAIVDSGRHITTIIVAQRVATIMHADRIIVLDEGRIVGNGTHEELLDSCPTYLEIAQSQLSPDELTGKGGER